MKLLIKNGKQTGSTDKMKFKIIKEIISKFHTRLIMKVIGKKTVIANASLSLNKPINFENGLLFNSNLDFTALNDSKQEGILIVGKGDDDGQ